MIHCIILAAGMSRRMGAENKMLLPFRDSTIFETTFSNIIQADMGEILVVVGFDAKKIRNALKKYPLSIFNKIRIVENNNYEQGMTSSIKTGIRALKPQNTEGGVMVCLSDMPLISPEEYRFKATEFLTILKQDEKAIVVPFYKGEKGNPVIFSNFYKNALLNLEDTEGGKSILKTYQKHVYKIEMPTDSILLDADTPEDYQRLLRSTD
jgi:molybdenum cofactor cytidylyltransferase